MKRWQTAAIAAALLVVVLLAGIHAFTGLLTAAPRVELAALSDMHPAVRCRINFELIEDRIVEQVRTSGQSDAPEFLVRAMLPRGATLWMAPNFDRGMVEVETLLHERRGGRLMARIINRQGAYAEIEPVAFDADGVQAPRRGAITLDGWFPLEKNAGDALYDRFMADPAPDLPGMDGSHLLELRADNRNGAAYVVFASLLQAFEIKLGEREEKISLTSFRFVEQVVITADVVLGDSIGIVCEMNIEPGQKNKLAVTNLKAGLDELFERMGDQLQRDHGLTLTGQSEWRGDTMVFTYRLDDVPALLQALGPLN